MERQFRLPGGKIIDYFNWGSVANPIIVFPLTQDNKVVAIRQFRYGANEVLIEFPGGCPDKGEATPLKELEEETGYSAESFVKLGPARWFEPAECLTSYIPLLALGCKKTGKSKLDETEFIKTFVIPLPEWIAMIHRGEILDSKTIAITFLALLHLGIKLD